ncbi:hypothetical protein [Klebsiella sp. GG_Kp157]|uniref:hypothetical protein n=1 Tax=Klebsiella sp. GG_Kp157 TaxID=3153468 RepID=UPI0027F65E71|nr:hypothetical protein [Klebsiella variicola]
MAHNIPTLAGVKTALRRLNQRFQRDLHKVIAIDYLPGAGACADITVLIINNQDL